MQFSDFVPRMDQRALFVGKTGSGKTWAAGRVLRWVKHVDGSIEPRKHILAYDAKGLIRWPNFARVTSFAALERKANDPKHFPKILYAPNANELRDPDFHEKFFLLCYERGNTTAYVDEWYALCRGEIYPPSAHAILTRGREMGVSLIGATQRPMKLAQPILSEADLIYAFHLKMPQDRKKMAEMIPVRGDDLEPQSLPKTKFYFYEDGADDVTGPHRLDDKKEALP